MSNVRIYWAKLTDKQKVRAKELYDSGNANGLFQYLRAVGAVIVAGCSCSVTSGQIKRMTENAIKKGWL